MAASTQGTSLSKPYIIKDKELPSPKKALSPLKNEQNTRNSYIDVRARLVIKALAEHMEQHRKELESRQTLLTGMEKTLQTAATDFEKKYERVVIDKTLNEIKKRLLSDEEFLARLVEIVAKKQRSKL